MMRDFRKLKVWDEAHQLPLDVCRISSSFPTDERFGLTAQLRPAAASIALNLAEGSGRASSKAYGYFVELAIGSVNELE
jgi:four helix bundle protein